ncbi:hypothetical protein LIP_2128 [Limnochorda pilosa]|uniref:Uncharacterized protein n=1 Tax=Limnochorda pilosa TaxID=1555112 RepID=A0A0K2SMB2_LIMPI|nr:hypothetical protein LIP_2128 [Limnochorda pilosa]
MTCCGAEVPRGRLPGAYERAYVGAVHRQKIDFEWGELAGGARGPELRDPYARSDEEAQAIIAAARAGL